MEGSRLGDVLAKEEGDKGPVLSEPITYLLQEVVHFGISEGECSGTYMAGIDESQGEELSD